MDAGALTLLVIVSVLFPPFIPLAIVLVILDQREKRRHKR